MANTAFLFGVRRRSGEGIRGSEPLGRGAKMSKAFIGRLCLAISLVLLAAVPTVLRAQSPGQKVGRNLQTFETSDQAEITQLINGYFHAFTVKDYAALPNFFQAPFLTSFSKVSVIGTVDEVVQRYHHIRDPLDRTDYATSKAEEMRITALSAESALVDIHWRRYKKDGELFNEGAEILVVSKSSGRWKISGSVGQDLSQFGKAY